MKKIKIAFIGIILICAFALNYSIFSNENVILNANADDPPVDPRFGYPWPGNGNGTYNYFRDSDGHCHFIKGVLWQPPKLRCI